MHITANVTNRFAHTLISSKVKNFASDAKEASFSVVLPETAYISGFVLEIDGNRYKAYIKEKEEAKNIYNEVCSCVFFSEKCIQLIFVAVGGP